MSHAHAVALHQDVVGQIILLIEPQKLRQSIPSLWQLVDFIQKTVKRGGKRLSKQRVLFVVGESPVPIYVSLFWLKQAAREESLQFVFKADFLIRNRPVTHSGQRRMQERSRDSPGPLCKHVSAAGDVPAKKFEIGRASCREREKMPVGGV